jgi:hypothetical protein
MSNRRMAFAEHHELALFSSPGGDPSDTSARQVEAIRAICAARHPTSLPLDQSRVHSTTPPSLGITWILVPFTAWRAPLCIYHTPSHLHSVFRPILSAFIPDLPFSWFNQGKVLAETPILVLLRPAPQPRSLFITLLLVYLLQLSQQ